MFRFTVFPAERIREVSGFPWFYEETEKRPPLEYACLVERCRPRNETVSLLLKKLRDPDRTTRYWAAQTLRSIEAESDEVKESLRELLNDSYQRVREAAAEALKRIRGE